MTLSGINGAALQPAASGAGIGTAADAYSKNLQKQIADAQKKLQEISSSQELTPEEKMKKKQEITQEISSLNHQLRQHQMEVRRQALQGQENAKSNGEDGRVSGTSKGQKKPGRADSGMSSAGMQAVISADAALERVQVQDNVKTRMEDHAGILKAEIKQDGGSESKEAELAEVEERAAALESTQMRALADINESLQNAAGEGERQASGKSTEAGKTGETAAGSVETGEGAAGSTEAGKAAAGSAEAGKAAAGSAETGKAAAGSTRTGKAAAGSTATGKTAAGSTEAGKAAAGSGSTGKAAKENAEAVGAEASAGNAEPGKAGEHTGKAETEGQTAASQPGRGLFMRYVPIDVRI